MLGVSGNVYRKSALSVISFNEITKNICDPLCEIQAKASKSNYEIITSIKV